MISTVTLNPSWDTVAVVDQLRIGEVNRSCREFSYAGGKGIDVSRTIHRLGGQTCALGLLAGTNGARIETYLSSEGITHDFIKVAGDTRSNILLENQQTSEETIIQHTSDITVTAADLATLMAKIRQSSCRSKVMVFSGSLPTTLPVSIYAELVAVAQENDCRTILDTSGEALRAGIQARPYLIKPNRFEMEFIVDKPLPSCADVIEAVNSTLLADIETVVVSLGGQGVVVRSGTTIFAVEPIRTKVISYAGAGDSLVGGIALGLFRQEDIRQAVTMGVAAATATLSHYGSSFFDHENYHTNLTKIIIQEISHAVQ